jgi:RNA polymerase sigma factor (TIGR02999 family)
MLGDTQDVDPLFAEIMSELRATALNQAAKERHFAAIGITELISELWVKQLWKRGWTIKDRHHFFAIVGQVMRHILVDLARARVAAFRGGGETPLAIDNPQVFGRISVNDDRQTVEIGMAMERIEARAPLTAQVIDLHYLVGYTLEEVARHLGISYKQARLAWADGRKRLLRELTNKRRPLLNSRPSAAPLPANP